VSDLPDGDVHGDPDPGLQIAGVAVSPRDWLLLGGDPSVVLKLAPTLGDGGIESAAVADRTGSARPLLTLPSTRLPLRLGSRTGGVAVRNP
jgi:hypothetical protein